MKQLLIFILLVIITSTVSILLPWFYTGVLAPISIAICCYVISIPITAKLFPPPPVSNSNDAGSPPS